MSGWAISQRFSEDRYDQPSASTRGVSEKRRPSERTWPSRSSVSRIRRAVARVMPVRRATSLRVGRRVVPGEHLEHRETALQRLHRLRLARSLPARGRVFSHKRGLYMVRAHACAQRTPHVPLRGDRRERQRRRHRRPRGLHPPDPLRGRPRDHPPGPPRPHARPHDAGPDLRPAHRHGLRRASSIFSYGGNPGVGSLHRFRDAVENDWPRPLEIVEHSHAGLANAYVAGAAGLPFAVLRGYIGHRPRRAQPARSSQVECPFTGEQLSAVSAINPDVVGHPRPAGRRAGQRHALGPVRRAEGGGAGRRARDRDRRGGRRRARAAPALDRAARLGASPRSPPCRTARIRPTRTATRRATTTSTPRGTRSRATATASSRGWTSTCVRGATG